MISIDIFSDLICPWCYIGKHGLIELWRLPRIKFSNQMEAIFLNPDMPIEGMDRKEYLVQKFGE